MRIFLGILLSSLSAFAADAAQDTRRFFLRDFQIVGFGATEQLAQEDLQKECKTLGAMLKTAFEDTYADVDCGVKPDKYSLDFDSKKLVALASRAVGIVRIPKGVMVESKDIGDIESDAVHRTTNNFRSWQEACRLWIFDQINLHGDKLIGASCGGMGEKEILSGNYGSKGRIYLKK